MKRIAAAAGLITAAIVLTACSGGSGSSGSSDGGTALSRVDRAQPNATAPSPARAEASGQASSGSSEGSTGSTGSTSAPVGGTLLIKTASIQVNVAKPADVARQADAAAQIATAAGGSVYADNRSAGRDGSAELTLKVPPESLSAVLARLSALGREVSRQSGSEDVTTQVADVNSRVASARDSLVRLRALYSHAEKISDIIAIESELAQREADLESLQATQRSLAAETSMATVSLYLSTSAVAPAAPKPDRKGFVGGLERGWDSFTSAASSVATGLGSALPFLVLVLLLGAAGWRLWTRRTHPAPSARPVPAAPTGPPAE